MNAREQTWAAAAATAAQSDAPLNFERLAVRLATIGELGAAVQTALDIPAIHRAVAKHARWLLDAACCTLALVDVDGVGGCYRVFPTPGAPRSAAVLGLPGSGWVGWVLEHEQTVVATPAMDRARFRADQDNGSIAADAASALYLPLRSVGVLNGVLVFASRAEHAYDSSTLAVAHLIQLQVAAAVHNALLVARLESAEAVIRSLAHAVEAKDSYTEGHCRRLASYGVQVGTALGLPERDLKTLDQGGLLHDIGKIAIPESILLKPGRLTAAEFTIMQGHVEAGVRICAPLQSLRYALPVIRHHHERWNGLGYPDGLAGETIPLAARIISVVDAYDAMTTTRPYREAMPVERALSILHENRGPQWDPAIVACFTGLMQRRAA